MPFKIPEEHDGISILQRVVPSILIFCCGALLSWLGEIVVTKQAEGKGNSTFLALTQNVENTVYSRMRETEQSLRNLSAMVGSNPTHPAEVLDAFLRSAVRQVDVPPVISTGVLEYLAPLEGSTRTIGERNGTLYVRAIEPRTYGNNEIGADLLSRSIILSTALNAYHSGRTAITPPLVIGERPFGLRVLFVCVPITANTESGVQDQPRWVFSVLNLPRLFETVFEGARENLTFRITDISERGAPLSLFADAQFNEAAGEITDNRNLSVADRIWSLEFRPTASFMASFRNTGPSKTFFTGLICASLLSLLVWSMQTSRQRAVALARAITEDLVAAQGALVESNKRLSLVMQGTSDGVWDWDRTRGVIHWSDRFLEQLGYTPGDLAPTENSIKELLHPEDRSAVLTALDRHLDARAPFDVETRVRSKNGEYLWFRWRAQAVWDNQGKAVRLVGAQTDIAMRKRFEAELAERREQAEASARAKGEFLANMSHEIRTPMNAILGMAEMLAETRLETQQREYVQVLRDSGEHLLSIINDILDLARIENGSLKVATERFNLRETCEQAARLVTLSAEKKGLELRTEIDPGLPALVVGDRKRISQVLANLLSNAVKFTERGSVTLRVQPHDPDPGQIVMFSVADTGPGISQELIPRLFERFSQADSSSTRKHGGTGLGLSISKQLVALLGGELWVESEQLRGTTFSFCLRLPPAADQSSPLHPHAAVTAHAAARSGTRRILVAEDHRENQRIIEAFLKGFDIEIHFAENGEQAFEQFKQGKFDGALLDIQMPLLDGHETARRIRAYESAQALRRTPLIAVTAHALPGDQDKALESGCDAYISKPIKRALLISMLQNLVGIAKLDGPAATTPESELEAIKPVFLSNTQRDLEALRLALSNSDFDALTAGLHRIRGVCNILGMPQLFEVATRVETAAYSKDHSLVNAGLLEMENLLGPAEKLQ